MKVLLSFTCLAFSFTLMLHPGLYASASKAHRCLAVFKPAVVALSLLSFQAAGVDSVHAQTDQIPTSTELTNAEIFKPLPRFPNEEIFFVQNGVEVEDPMDLYLADETVEAIRQGGLHWLSVKNVRVDTRDIERTPTGYRMRILVSQHYVKVKETIEGTAIAVFEVKLNPRAAVETERAQVTLTTYDDEESSSAAGRRRWGIDFDKFLDSVAGRVLRMHLSDSTSFNQLLVLAAANIPPPHQDSK